MPFYHGSASALEAGEILYPGSVVGLSWHGRSNHVYMTQTYFSMTEVESIPAGITSAAQFAVYSAALWGCIAADGYCEDDCEWSLNHSNALNALILPDCVKVYEVEPLGPITDDDAHDVDPDACRTTEAKILRRIDDREIADRLKW